MAKASSRRAPRYEPPVRHQPQNDFSDDDRPQRAARYLREDISASEQYERDQIRSQEPEPPSLYSRKDRSRHSTSSDAADQIARSNRDSLPYEPDQSRPHNGSSEQHTLGQTRNRHEYLDGASTRQS